MSETICFQELYPEANRNIMWIGAHPDDETLVASILGELCVDGDWSATLLVTTRGGNGPNLLSDRPEPLEKLRWDEMQKSAAIFNATVLHWDLGDSFGKTPEQVRHDWCEKAGGEKQLIKDLTGAIHDAAPDVLLTFDPRHGTTLHPAHRVVAALVIEATQRVAPESRPDLYMVTSRIESPEDGTYIGQVPMVPEDESVLTYDAARHLESIGADAWDYAARVIEAHPSQFGEKAVEAILKAPPPLRQVHLIRLDDEVDLDDSRYAAAITPEATQGWIERFVRAAS